MKIFQVFYNILAWRPSWSCDLYQLNTLSFLHHMEAPYEIWLWLSSGLWDVWKCWYTYNTHTCTHTHIRTAEATYPILILISSPLSLWIRWAKKRRNVCNLCQLVHVITTLMRASSSTAIMWFRILYSMRSLESTRLCSRVFQSRLCSMSVTLGVLW